MSDGFRKVDTGQFRFRLMGQLRREPVIVLQKEVRGQEYVRSYSGNGWVTKYESWVDVTIEDLTVMSLTKLINPVQSEELPICFKPHKKLFGWCLVLQVCDGSYSLNQWRPARLQDLILKDGKIQGGLGLMARAA